MKLKTILSLAFVIGIAAAVFFQDSNQKLGNPVAAQIGGGCGSFSSATYPCGNGETCGLGDYTSTAAFYNGAGIDGQELRDVNCQGTSCGNVQSVSTAYYNAACCDQDNDGYYRTACGGTDCNDNDYNINPGKPEICDGKDNNCNGQTDENCPTPTPTPPPGTCNMSPPCATGFVVTGSGLCGRSSQFQHRCAEPSGYDPDTCTCPDGINNSPIIIDVDGGGFSLTDALNGVDFDIHDFGFSQRLGWTANGSTNAFLVLDRNGNGTIDNGKELVGNITPQPEPPAGEERRGFLAFAQFDKPAKGGNNDGKINYRDAVFARLRLWQDINHNGVSEANELHTLPDLGLRRIDLDYRESRRTDQYGNRFKYRAKVRDAQDAQLGRWAWDVFLVSETP